MGIECDVYFFFDPGLLSYINYKLVSSCQVAVLAGQSFQLNFSWYVDPVIWKIMKQTLIHNTPLYCYSLITVSIFVMSTDLCFEAIIYLFSDMICKSSILQKGIKQVMQPATGSEMTHNMILMTSKSTQ